MAKSALSNQTSDHYDVCISFMQSDSESAGRLYEHLVELGLSCCAIPHKHTGADVSSLARTRGLIASDNLIVIWGPAAVTTVHRSGILEEIADFEQRKARPTRRQILFVVLGDGELLERVPALDTPGASVVLAGDVYAAGYTTREWKKALRYIGQFLGKGDPPLPGRPERPLREAPAPSVSTAARRALSYASVMLGGREHDQTRRRAAVLLAALRASSSSSGHTTPSTGDVLKLALTRQTDGRSASGMIDAAAIA